MFRAAILAGVGGLLPTCAKLAATFVTKPNEPLPHPHILIGLLIFFTIGAVLSFAFNKDHDLGKALVLGISAPGIISNIVAGVGAPTPAGTGSTTAQVAIFSPQAFDWMVHVIDLRAWAEEDTQPSSDATGVPADQPAPPSTEAAPPSAGGTAQPTPSPADSPMGETAQPAPGDAISPAMEDNSSKNVLLRTNVVGGGINEDATIFYGAVVNGKYMDLGSMPAGQALELNVPKSATDLVVKLGHDERRLNLWPQQSAQDYQVNVKILTKPTGWGDFLWSLGGSRPTAGEIAGVRAEPYMQGGVSPPNVEPPPQ
jgi:hypothetical protein